MTKTKKNSIRTVEGYEKSYLLFNRLSSSMTAKDEMFLKTTDVQKIVRHMSNVAARKYKLNLHKAGIERDDMISVASCYALVFSQHYSDKYPNKRDKMYRLMSFIGQKLFYYVQTASVKKHKEWAVLAKEPDFKTYSPPVPEKKDERSVLFERLQHANPEQIEKLYRLSRNKTMDINTQTLALDLWMALPGNKKGGNTK